jgi:hypothetical protein
MQEAVGDGNHKTALLMVKAMDALWAAHGNHNPKVAAATNHHSRSLAPVGGKRWDKRGSVARSKSLPLPSKIFFSFPNPGNGVCKYHNYYNARAYKCVNPCPWSEN